MKILIKYIGFYLIFLVLLIFICSLLNLIGVNSTITNLLLFIFNIICFFIFGFKNGNKSNAKGYIAGLKISGLLLLILIIINTFTSKTFFNLLTIIYYLILLLTGIFGGMIGINHKKEK